MDEEKIFLSADPEKIISAGVDPFIAFPLLRR